MLEESWANETKDRRFIPHIQLHEYEAYLFTDISVLENYYEDRKRDFVRLKRSVDPLGSPELIDDGQESAPSKRIIACVPQYESDKLTVGVQAATRIGLPAIRDRCPHFASWGGSPREPCALKLRPSEETGVTVRAGEPIWSFDSVIRDEEGRVAFHYVIVDLLADYLGGRAARPGRRGRGPLGPARGALRPPREQADPRAPRAHRLPSPRGPPPLPLTPRVAPPCTAAGRCLAPAPRILPAR